jgi:hypothetical protein
MAWCVIVVGALLVARALVRLRRVLGAQPLDPLPLAAWLRRGEPGALEALAAELDAERDGVLGRLAPEIVGVRGPELVKACNEALYEVEADLSWGEGAGAAGLRACLFVTAFAAVASLGLRRGVSVELFDALALGAGFAVTLAWADRLAERASREGRSALDKWVDAALSQGIKGARVPVDRPS